MNNLPNIVTQLFPNGLNPRPVDHKSNADALPAVPQRHAPHCDVLTLNSEDHHKIQENRYRQKPLYLDRFRFPTCPDKLSHLYFKADVYE